MREVVLPAAALTLGVILALSAAMAEISPGPSAPPERSKNRPTLWVGATGLVLIAIAVVLMLETEHS